jgi:hypothetical protein
MDVPAIKDARKVFGQNNVNNLKAGREYIEAYVKFFKFSEGESEGHNDIHAESISKSEHLH